MKTFRFLSCTLASILLLAACSTAQKAKNASLTGESDVNAVTKLKMNESDSKSYSDIYDYLRSRVPGLLIRGEEVYIRGINSINAVSSPLILVDGVEIEDLSTVNPYDVDGVEVIKDASSAIYGFRASGGVIKITTKAGKNTGQTNL